LVNSGASKLAQVIAERISTQTSMPDALELGTIQSDMSLKIDRFAVPIPQGEYLISEWTAKLILPAFSLGGNQNGLKDSMNGAVTGDATFNFQPTVINGVKIEFKPELKPGDRVLVAWVNDHTDPVVVSKVVNS
jgi:hypothetical protein